MTLLARRRLLLALGSIPFASGCVAMSAAMAASASRSLADLETAAGGRLGVAAVDTANDSWLTHRANERFPMCSTFKVFAASAVLRRSMREVDLLERRIAYTPADLVTYSPITERHVEHGMTVDALCAAALRYSDNTAGNLLLRLIGGPAALTAFAREIGDREFRLDRWETELNSAIPGDPRDTSTPEVMAGSLRALALGDALAPSRADTAGARARDRLVDWMRGNTTGAARIRAGVPADWVVGDKTGGGDFGVTNDIGVLWPPGRPPIVLALFFTQPRREAGMRNDVLAEATRVVVRAFG